MYGIVLGIVLSLSPTSEKNPLTLENAVKTAYFNRPDLKKSFHDIRASRESQRVALSGYLPQITVEAGAGESSGYGFFAPQRFVNLGFTQLLYAPAGPIQEYRIARQDTYIAQWQQHVMRNTIRYETETNILDIWAAQQKKQLIQDYDVSSRLLFDEQENQYQVGLADLATYKQYVADFALAQSRIKKYSDELVVASNNLEKSLGINCLPTTEINEISVTNFVDQALLEVDNQSADSYFQHALACRYELKVLDAKATQEAYWQRYYCKSYFPSLSLYTNIVKYSYKGKIAGFLEGPLASGWNAGVKLNWQFDGLANVFHQGAAQERSYSAMMDRITFMTKIKQEVNNNHAQLLIAYKEYVSTKKEYDRAKNEFDLRSKQFEVGLISPVEMKHAETLWLKAEYDFLSSKITVAKRYSSLLFSCGYPKIQQQSLG